MATIDGRQGPPALHRWGAREPHVRRRDRPRLRRARRPLRPRRRGAGRRGRRRLRRRPPRPRRVRGRARARSRTSSALVDDPRASSSTRRGEHPACPSCMVGHSLGGLDRHPLRPAPRPRARRARALGAGRRRQPGPARAGRPARDPRRSRSTPSVLSRDPAVGEAYAADPLVYHGAVQARDAAGDRRRRSRRSPRAATSASCRRCGSTATEDVLVPLGPARPAVERVRGTRVRGAASTPGARHEIFNETNQDEVIADVVAFIERSL